MMGDSLILILFRITVKAIRNYKKKKLINDEVLLFKNKCRENSYQAFPRFNVW